MGQYSQRQWVVTAIIVGVLLVLFVVLHGLTLSGALTGIIGGIVAILLVRFVRKRSQ